MSPVYFRDWMTVKPDELRPDDVIALKVVARVGHDNDFAVYAGPEDWSVWQVVMDGDKLFSEEACLGMFPQIARSGRRVRT